MCVVIGAMRAVSDACARLLARLRDICLWDSPPCGCALDQALLPLALAKESEAESIVDHLGQPPLIPGLTLAPLTPAPAEIKPARPRLKLGPREAECELSVVDEEHHVEAITVQQLIYQFKDAVRVMRVSVQPRPGHGGAWLACLKLRVGAASADAERAVYARMRGTPVARLFLRVHFFCTVAMPDGTQWSGYCMELGDFGASHLTSVDISAVVKRSYFALYHQQSQGGEDGEPVNIVEWPTVQDAVAVACLRLLGRIHAAGWIHGDSHGGNFMCVRGRVFAIDFERAFATADPVHHFLDVQEFFGHVTWVLLSRENPDRWDLNQSVAIYTRRHPSLSATEARPALHMLPLCQCFACVDMQERVEGCDLCRSPANVRSAGEFAADPERFIADAGAWGLNNMRSSLGHTRHACIRHCRELARVLHPCLLCPRISAQGCMELLWHEVYAPAVSEEAARENRRLEDRLRSSGFTAQADLLRASTPPLLRL